MKIDDSILHKMVDSLKRHLPSFHSHKRTARQYAKLFLLAYTEAEKEFVIKEMLHQQNRSIIKAIENKKNISIPSLGSFQYRESMEICKQIKDDVKNELGVSKLKDLDKESYSLALDEINVRKKKVLLPLYFKQLDIKNSTVKLDFKDPNKKYRAVGFGEE